MLKLIRTLPDSNVQELQEERIDSGIPSLTDYNGTTQSFSTTRTSFAVTGWAEEKLTTYLETHPDACIYNIVSHAPTRVPGESLIDSAEDQRVVIKDKPFIDQFGKYVYVLSQVSWTRKDDIDNRFDNGVYPQELESELLIYQW